MSAARRQGVFSKIVVVLIILLNVWFAACVIYLLWLSIKKGNPAEWPPEAFFYGWFVFTCSELACLCGVKCRKIKYEGNPLEVEDEDDDDGDDDPETE